MNNASDQLLEVFLFEMSSLLEQLDETLLVSEKNQSLTEDDVNEIFRIMHTIKGSSAMMEFQGISSLTHKLEDCFYLIRESGINQLYFTRLFDLMLEATDFLKSQLMVIQSGAAPEETSPDLLSRAEALYALLNGEDVPNDQSAPAESALPAPSQAPLTAEDVSTYQVNVLFEEDCGMENLRALMLVNSLSELCNVVSFEPADIETNTDTASHILINGFSMVLESDMELEQLQESLENSLHVKSATVLPAIQAEDTGNYSDQRYDIIVHFEEDCGVENLRAFMLINSLRSKCNVVSFSPSNIESDSSTAAIIMKDGFFLTIETNIPLTKLQELLDNSMYVKKAQIALSTGAAPETGDAHAPGAAAPATAVPAPAASTVSKPRPVPVAPQPATMSSPAGPALKQPAGDAAETAPAKKAPVAHKPIRQNLINVSLSKLDELMDLMGELVISESMVTRNPELQGLDKLDSFHKASRQLRKLIDELQDMVMSIRMVPVADTFIKMNRVVRDMCRTLGKEAELVTSGEETDIDKTIIDTISDPIMHLVRNAMDHGVESPSERESRGKPRKATITLSAENTGGEILITVSDDGRGLDAAALLEKANENGLLTKPMEEYTEREAFQLLLLPGFSTKETVTEYSGRGVGLDVVKKNIEKIGGNAIIESVPDQGMTVFLKIPLTLAIVEGMELAVGSGIYTLPITAINESFKAQHDQVFIDTEGNEMIMMRGDVFPVIRLHQLYDIPDATTDVEEGIMIWVSSGSQSACLFVDQLIGEQQIVVKPLPLYLNNYDIKSYGISGCTILGDGNISLILDAGSIIETIMEKR